MFRAIAGFGRHGVVTEQAFFELAGRLPVGVEFVVTAAQTDALPNLTRVDAPSLFNTCAGVEFGVITATF